MLFSGLPPEAGCRAGFTIPIWNGQSRPVTEHRPPAWGQHGVLYNNQTLMTAFTFRPCWPRDLLHVALGSIFSFARSDLKAWPVLPSGEDDSGVGNCSDLRGSEGLKVENRGRIPIVDAQADGYQTTFAPIRLTKSEQLPEWHPDFTPRDLVKQLLLYGCLPRSKIGLIAAFRFR